MSGRSKPLPYLRWYVNDYRASRRVQKLTWEERGIYRELLDECWVEGGIPDDPERLAEIVGCPVDVLTSAWPTIRPLFVPVDSDESFLTSRRLEIERSEDDTFRVKKANAGRLGGLAKASNAKQRLANPSQQLEQLEQSKSSSAARRVAAPRLGDAAAPSPDDEPASPEAIRAILDDLKAKRIP